MYFGILKMELDGETITDESYKHATNVCEKLKSRFKVLAKAYQPHSHELSLAIAVALFSKSEEKLNQSCHEILNFVETTGLGRVLTEGILIDSLDAIETDEPF